VILPTDVYAIDGFNFNAESQIWAGLLSKRCSTALLHPSTVNDLVFFQRAHLQLLADRRRAVVSACSMEASGNESAVAVCWEPTTWEAYLKIPVALLALVVCCLNLLFAAANVKFNKEASPLGKLMTTAFFANSAVPWLIRLFNFVLQEALSDYNAYLCMVLAMVYVCSMHFQACLLAAVAHDRKQLVCHSLTYREMAFQKRPWLFLLTCLAPPLIIVVGTMTAPQSACINSIMGCIANPNYFSLRTLIGIVGVGVLQWCCTIWYAASYVIIFRAVRRIAREPRMHPETGRRSLHTLAVLGAQHTVFVILPNTFGAATFSNFDFSSRLWLYKLLGVFYTGNYVIAPLKYVCFDSSVMKAVRKLFCGKRRSSRLR